MATTVQNIIDDVKACTDEDSSNQLSSAQYITWIDREVQRLRAWIARVRPREYMKLSANWTITGSNTTHVIGSGDSITDYLDFVGLDYLVDSNANTWQRIRPLAIQNRNGVWSRCYQLEGSTIRIFPIDLAVGTYRLWYVASHAALTAVNDVLAIPSASEDVITQGVAAKVRVRQDEDPSPHIALQAQYRRELLAQLKFRELAEPGGIADVSYEDDPYATGW